MKTMKGISAAETRHHPLIGCEKTALRSRAANGTLHVGHGQDPGTC